MYYFPNLSHHKHLFLIILWCVQGLRPLQYILEDAALHIFLLLSLSDFALPTFTILFLSFFFLYLAFSKHWLYPRHHLKCCIVIISLIPGQKSCEINITGHQRGPKRGETICPREVKHSSESRKKSSLSARMPLLLKKWPVLSSSTPRGKLPLPRPADTNNQFPNL